VVGGPRCGTRYHFLGFVEQGISTVEPVEVYHLVDPSEADPHHRIDAIGVELQRPSKEINRLCRGFPPLDVTDQRARTHDQVDSIPSFGLRVPAFGLGANQLDPDAARQARDDLVLDLQNFSALLVKALSPQVLVRLGVNQLDIDAKALVVDENAALQHVADAEFAAHLRDRNGTALVREGGGPRDDEATRQSARQIRDQDVDDPIDEIIKTRLSG
jgi:hypothetical protein